MARVLVSSVIDAPIDRVWEAIRRFDAVAELLPFVESSPIEDGREPITDGHRTLGEWSSRFTIAPDRKAELVGLMEKNFLAGLRALGERLA